MTHVFTQDTHRVTDNLVQAALVQDVARELGHVRAFCVRV